MTTLQLAALLPVLLGPVLVRPLVIAAGVLALASVVDYTLAVWRARERPMAPGLRPRHTPSASG